MYNFNQQNNYWYSVNGYEGAKNFNVAPNQTVLLVDSQEPFMYMKSANQMGQINIKTFKIQEMSMNPDQLAENEKYAMFDKRLAKIEELLIAKENGVSNNG